MPVVLVLRVRRVEDPLRAVDHELVRDAAGREVVVGIPNSRNLAKYTTFVDYSRIAGVEPLDESPAAARSPSPAH